MLALQASSSGGLGSKFEVFSVIATGVRWRGAGEDFGVQALGIWQLWVLCRLSRNLPVCSVPNTMPLHATGHQRALSGEVDSLQSCLPKPAFLRTAEACTCLHTRQNHGKYCCVIEDCRRLTSKLKL